jgi:hypothetical protein
VNKTTINDATSVSTAGSALSEWTTAPTIPNGNWSVLAVAQEARIQVGTTGPQHFEWLLRTGGTDYVSGSLAPSTSFSTFSNQLWSLNPNTSSAWSTTDLTTAGFNLGIESLP